MNETTGQYTYTADRSGFVSSAGGWILLFVLEGSVVATVIVIFAPGLPLKLGLLALFVAGLLYLILARFCAPLWTHHELGVDRLDLHYGGSHISIPRSEVESAAAIDAGKGLRFRPGAEYEAEGRAIVATFSTRGVVEVKLTEPKHFDAVEGSETVDRIVFNVDRRDDLLAALTGAPVIEREDTSSSLAPDEATQSIVALTRSPAAAGGTLAIATHRLEARFGDRVVVSDLHLAIRHGEIYGLLGANGAGKTTTLKMLVGLVAPSAGTVHIAGHDLERDAVLAKSAFGYMPDRAILYDRLSGREFLRFLARMRGITETEGERRIDQLLAMFDLSDRQDSPAGSYSFGMKRKLSLAGALIHEPSVLILDEPLNGLDPPGAHRLRNMLAEMRASGVGILLSTHDLATAGSIADRIGIMHKGRLVAEGSVDELTAGSPSGSPGSSAHRLESAFLRLTSAKQGERDASH